MLEEMQERAHSPISGSRMPRFMVCPISFVKDDRDFVDNRPKTAAIEGERAHDVAEREVLRRFESRLAPGNAVSGALDEGDDVTPSMKRGAGVYADAIGDALEEGGDDALVMTERFVAMGANFGGDSSNLGGYFDAMVYSIKARYLHIIDYKFGRHVVKPDTPQLTFYILATLIGGLDELRGSIEILDYVQRWYGDWTFKQTIVQPRDPCEPVKTYALEFEKLCTFAQCLERCFDVWKCESEFKTALTRPSEHCKYCEKRLICPNSSLDLGIKCGFTFEKRESVK